MRVRYPRKGLAASKPGTLLRHQVPSHNGPPDNSLPEHLGTNPVAPCGDTTAGSFVHALTFTELYSGWTEIRAVWNESRHAILAELLSLEAQVPFPMRSYHADNGSEFLNWPLCEAAGVVIVQISVPCSKAIIPALTPPRAGLM